MSKDSSIELSTYEDGSKLKLHQTDSGVYALYRSGGAGGFSLILEGTREMMKDLAQKLLAAVQEARNGNI